MTSADAASAKIETTAVDPKEAEKLKKSILSAEQAPTLAEQTPDQSTWQALRDTIGPPFDSERVTLAQLRQIRKDSMVAFGLHYIKVPHVMAEWHIDARDRNGPNAAVAGFVDAALRIIYARLIFQRMLALDFGFQGIAKRFILQNPSAFYIDLTEQDPEKQLKPVWDEGENVLPIIWKAPVALRPEQTTPKFDDKTGEFAGILYDVPPAQRNKASGFRTGRQKGNQAQREIDIYHSYWATNQKDDEHGSVYGYPRIGFARDYWWMYRFLFMMSGRAYERLAIPPVLAYHPEGQTVVDSETGESRENWELALEAAERLRSNAVAAVPSTMATAGLDGSTTQREWDFKFMETPFEALRIFDERFNYLNVMKLRSCWVPELAFVGNGVGGNTAGNIAAQMAEIFLESQALLMADVDDEINRIWIPQLLRINYPDFLDNGGVARKISHGFRSEDVEFYKQAIQLIGQAKPEALAQIDTMELLRRMNMPLKTPSQLAAERNNLAAQVASAGPPQVEPQAGQVGTIANPGVNPGFQNGGSAPAVNDDGTGAVAGFAEVPFVYTNGREVSMFFSDSATDDFLSGLPDSKHYKDKAIRALMLQLRRLWLAHYKRLYPEFAGYVNGAKVNLSDIEDAVDSALLSLQFATEDSENGNGKKIAAAAAGAAVTLAAAKKATNALLKGFAIDSKVLAELASKSAAIIRKILSRAAAIDMKEGNIKAELLEDAWDDFLTSQIGRLIKLTNESVKNELRDFLVREIREGKSSEEIADDIRAHFTGFEGHKADRVARSEVRDAVNAASLIVSEAASLRYVRATDGEEFDEECRKRNGKLFTVKEAWKELHKEHPYGTLGFEPIARANFSIEVVNELPEDAPEGVVGFFDDNTDTAYILFDEPAADEYLDALGAALVA